MRQYLDLLREVKENGVMRQDRTGVGTRAMFGKQLVFETREKFPLLTTKRIHFKSVKHELLWFLSGSTNVRDLHKHNVTIWDEWADENGELGPIYGKQWRGWSLAGGGKIDQIGQLLEMIRDDPNSRRMLLSSWNVGELRQMRLLPCHVLTQAWVDSGKLSLSVYQRSADIFLGLPFNIASYALLQQLLAHVSGLVVAKLVFFLGEAHLYNNHFDQATLQLERKPCALPKLLLSQNIKDIFSFTSEDIVLQDYRPHPAIRAKVAV